MQIEPEAMKPLVNRAKRAQGHLAKVIAMMEEGGDCEEVLTQFAAVLKALERTGFGIVATGLHQCLASGEGLDGVDAQKMQKLFLTLA